MSRWMNKLSYHYQKTRSMYPDDKLIILFDIDGTIVDTRYMVLHALNSFDRIHGASHFRDVDVSQVTMYEDQVEDLLEAMGLPADVQERVSQWYRGDLWTSKAILESHRPYHGVMEVMRWFQIQPNTHVGLNTGRSERLRQDTLRTLSLLGEKYKLEMRDELLFMNPGNTGKSVEEVKVDGVERFRDLGYRVFGMIDNEPENLLAISEMPGAEEIMLLHADTLFLSQRQRLPQGSISGRVFDLPELAVEAALPQHVQFVWHGLNDSGNLHEFMKSNVQWGEMDVRLHPRTRQLLLRRDPFNDPSELAHDHLIFDDVLRRLKNAGKSVKVDIKEAGDTLEEAVYALYASGIDHSRVWINGKIEDLRSHGFRRLSKEFPTATIQCPIDFMPPLMNILPDRARMLLDEFRSWGINRFSIKWDTPDMRLALDLLDRWGYELNIYNVPDLQAFLRAALLQPTSVTSDFNFPWWQRHGPGPAEAGARSGAAGLALHPSLLRLTGSG